MWAVLGVTHASCFASHNQWVVPRKSPIRMLCVKVFYVDVETMTPARWFIATCHTMVMRGLMKGRASGEDWCNGCKAGEMASHALPD